MPNLLLADDDFELCELLTDYLSQQGFSVTTVHDGAAAVDHLFKQATYDAIILDVMMPHLTGFEALQKIRAHGNTPVLMLTARGEDIDRITGLDMGADDYLPKPCNPRELLARLNAILRRSQPDNLPAKLVVDDIELRLAERTVLSAGRVIELTSTEFAVLAVLLNAAGQLVSKAALTEQGLGRRLMQHDRSIDMHVSKLRKKLGPARDGSERIKTVRNGGYLYVKAT